MNTMRRSLVDVCTTLCLTVALLSIPLLGAERTARYALILSDQPAVKSMKKGGRRDAAEVINARQQIVSKQAALRSQLASKGFHVTGSTNLLLNAVFVSATTADVATLRAMPGVRAVFPMRIQKLNLNAAVNLVSAPQAWNVLGGTTNAGAGIKIGIIDTGIDQTHPAFQDSTLTAPANYPPAGSTPNVPSYTNSKVIVARSYVALEATGTSAATSTPDDTSPQDRVGHGTAVAMCAGGNTNTGPLATITGLAPKAFLGNYKVFGSPGIIDGAYEDAILMALDDAMADGMDVVNISLGGPTFSAPLEADAFCISELGSSPCDPEAVAVENAVTANMVVVTAAGNEGYYGYFNGPPTFDTVGSPAYAPDAIAAAATGNSHIATQDVTIAGPNVPANITAIQALEDESTYLYSPLTAPLIDASSVGDVYGCTAFPFNSMSGYIALISRGGPGSGCEFETKLSNAADAGAIGVIFYNNGQSPDLISVAGDSSLVPSFFIGTNDGANIKAYVDANPSATATLNPTLIGFTMSEDSNEVTYFSSRGPALGYGLKPDVAAPGENIYTAAQSFDPNGEVYDPSGYVSVSGTSFSSPITAGIAAMVRQNNPNLTATQVKSAIVNTATSDTTDPYVTYPTGTALGVLSVGGGKVSGINAISSNVTVEPATISFGALSGTVNGTQALTITNFSTSPVTLTIGVTRTVADTATQLTTSVSTLALTAAGTSGAVGTVNATLTGTTPAPGIYQGVITVTGGAQALHVPYLYLVGDGVPYDLISLAGDDAIGSFAGTVGQPVSDGFSAFQIVDQYGVPVANLPVTWTALTGNGSSVMDADTTTNQYGEALAEPILGTVPGTYSYQVTITGLNIDGQNTYTFTDDAIAVATINAGGVVNAASNALTGNGVAPGSYISIYGTGLALGDYIAGFTPLPISIDYTSVGFFGTNISIPAPLSFVGANQINAQVPWELAGQTSVQLKVDIEPNYGNLVTIPIVTYSPAIFEVNGIAAAVVATGPTAGAIVTADAPVTRGQYISLYCNGLGPVSSQPATGAVALTSPLSSTPSLPTVTIGGQPATVTFSGLAPGYVGLYQVNVLVPTTAPAGDQPVALTIGGVAAPVLNLPLQ